MRSFAYLPPATSRSNVPRSTINLTNGSRSALNWRVKTFVFVVIMAGLGVVFLIQKRNEQSAATTAANQPVATQSVSPRPVSEHNWMKHALDTTAKVKRQVAEQRKEDGTR
jgi:hypothetical protein